jgi:hypothetical protein
MIKENIMIKHIINIRQLHPFKAVVSFEKQVGISYSNSPFFQDRALSHPLPHFPKVMVSAAFHVYLSNPLKIQSFNITMSERSYHEELGYSLTSEQWMLSTRYSLKSTQRQRR